MRMGVLITEGGSHPPDKWAAISAGQIADLIEIDEKSNTAEAAAARKAKPRFQLDLADALEKHHEQVQSSEKSNLAAKGVARHADKLDPNADGANRVDPAVDEVIAIAKKYGFGALDNPHSRAVIGSVLHSHMTSVMEIERKWHADGSAKKGA